MRPYRRHRRHFLAAAAATLLGGSLSRGLVTAAPADVPETVPITGKNQPELQPFDDLLSGFLREHSVPGAALAISRHGKLVYARGFGWADVEKQEPVQPDSLFRIASVSKPITAVAVLKLAEEKKLALDDKVLKYLQPLPQLAADYELDPRWEQITIRHCLQHTAGWDREESFDPIGRPGEIAKSLGVDFPITPDLIVRYMLGQKLDFDPGQKSCYSNFGYIILGRIIERVTGQAYETFVKRAVLAPVGITRMQLGKALREQRAAGEVRYYDSKDRVGRSLYPPRVGEDVPLPYGAQNLESFEAHGGWIASAVDLLRFACAFDNPANSPLLSAESNAEMWRRPTGLAGHAADGNPLPSYYACGWSVRPVRPVRDGKSNTWHAGLISGTAALLVRRWDGLNWAVLFNSDFSRKSEKFLAGLIDGPLHAAAEKVENWPVGDQFSGFVAQ